MIYVTGDCHAQFHKFSSKRFPAQKEMTREDFVIVCGDFGGASSHDIDHGILDRADFPSKRAFHRTYLDWYRAGKLFRVNHESWWAQELPSQEEMERGRKNLEGHGNQVDFVISYCLPQTLVHIFFRGEADSLTTYFSDLMRNGLQIGSWYCGHYHIDQWLMYKFRVLYDDIIRIL